MTRDDLLQVSQEALIDVTSRGAVRRALKEIADPAFVASFTEGAKTLVVTMGTVTVHLPVASALNAAQCSCPARSGCRHVVSAVLAYQQQHSPTPPTASLANSAEPQHNSPTTVEHPPASSLARITRADHLIVVHLLHPVPAAIRFHTGLDEAICSCRASSCTHREFARALLTSTPDVFGFVTTGNDVWTPSASALTAARSALHRLIDQGLEAGADTIGALFEFTAAQLDDAQMPYLADLLREALALGALYSGRRAAFHPAALLDVLGEAFVRIAALENPNQPLPYRVIAGTSGPLVDVARTTWLGLGTEVTPLVEGSRWSAYLLDESSGAVVRLTHDVAPGDPEPRVNSVPLTQWGNGRVVVPSARLGPHHDVRPMRGRVLRSRSTLPSSPHRTTDSLADIAAELSPVPPLLDQRPAMTAIHVATHLRFVPRHEHVDALLTDTDGQEVTVTWPASTAPALINAAQEFMATHADDVTISGRWSRGSEGLRVVPFLLVSGVDHLQPMVPGQTPGLSPSRDERPALKGPALLFADLDDALGEVMLAGMTRVRKDPRPWQELYDRSAEHGSERVASLAQELSQAGSSNLVEELLIFRAIAAHIDHPPM